MYKTITVKKLIIIVTIVFAINCESFSQSKPYNAVFDITTGDTAVHQRVIRWVNGILKEHPDAKLEVVFYGKSLPMVEAGKSTVAKDIINLAGSNKVIFAVCEQAMKVHNVDKNTLLQGVKTVPDALYELVSKQAEGYGYIKVTN